MRWKIVNPGLVYKSLSNNDFIYAHSNINIEKEIKSKKSIKRDKVERQSLVKKSP
jgi:hypothetical protein